jgi:hypothetical protein
MVSNMLAKMATGALSKLVAVAEVVRAVMARV